MNGYLSSLTFTKVKRYRDIFRGTLTSSKCKIMDLSVFKGIVYKKKKKKKKRKFCNNLLTLMLLKSHPFFFGGKQKKF